MKNNILLSLVVMCGSASVFCSESRNVQDLPLRSEVMKPYAKVGTRFDANRYEPAALPVKISGSANIISGFSNLHLRPEGMGFSIDKVSSTAVSQNQLWQDYTTDVTKTRFCRKSDQDRKDHNYHATGLSKLMIDEEREVKPQEIVQKMSSGIKRYFGYFSMPRKDRTNSVTAITDKPYQGLLFSADFTDSISSMGSGVTYNLEITPLQPKGTFAKRRRYAALGAAFTALGAVGLASKYLWPSKSPTAAAKG